MPPPAGSIDEADAPGVDGHGQEICCSMTSVLLAVLRRDVGEGAVTQVLAKAAGKREVSYLENPDNWISLAEATALLEAGVEVSGDPSFPTRVGEHTVRRHAGTQVSTFLRSLGSTEAVLQQITMTAAKLSAVTTLETLRAEAGHALVGAAARPGYTRTRAHCDWAKGLLASTTTLFGLPPARVTEPECQVDGAERCLYELAWDAELAEQAADPQQRVTALEAQMLAMSERLESCYATAGDLVSTSDLASVLQRIVVRAANAVRAPSHVLAVQSVQGDDLEIYCSGIEAGKARAVAYAALESSAVAGSMLAVPVASARRSYGQLIAYYPTTMEYFPHEEHHLRLYAQHAAAVLDMATALQEADRRQREIGSLHALSTVLAEAVRSEEVAERLTVAIPDVVDCDRVSVWLWDSEQRHLRLVSTSGSSERSAAHLDGLVIKPSDTPHLERMLSAPEPVLFMEDERDPFIARLMAALEVVALTVVPIVAHGSFLGVLTVAVTHEPRRLRPGPDLMGQLLSAAAHAATAVQNGQLLETLQHAASHDGLTGLLNRVGFKHEIDTALAAARAGGRRVGLLFVDLDGFKHVNDLHGHEVGDELIQRASQRLASSVRRSDAIARLGGDEFAVVLRDVEHDDEVRAAESRVRLAFVEPFNIGDCALSIGASVGGGIWPDDGATVADIVRYADGEMYVDKARKRPPAVSGAS